jgi:tetratricopeptide (TPR) repeat protein
LDVPAQEGSPKPAPLVRVPPVMAVVFVCVIGAITMLHAADFISNHTHVVYNSDSRFGLGESSWYPERAASFIRRERLPGNIFQEYELGGFAAWRLGPEYPDFIDGRSVSPAVLVEEQKLVSQSPDSPDWQAAADRWGFNIILVTEGEGAADSQDALGFCQSTQWSPVYMDESALVLLRNTAANRPWLDRLRIDCRTQELVPPTSASRKDLRDFWLNAGGLLFALQRYQESEASLLHAAALYPQDPNSRLILGQLYSRQQMLEKAEAEYLASLALRESYGAWFDLGGLYVQQRRLPEAEKAFSNAAGLSGSPYTAYMNLAQVELRMQHPAEALHAYAEAEKSSPYRYGAEGLALGFYADIADGRANAHRMLSHLPQAIQFEQEALRLNPGVANRWNKLAYLLEASGQLDLSRQAHQKAFELGPATQR